MAAIIAGGSAKEPGEKTGIGGLIFAAPSRQRRLFPPADW
jgi:hypothetical protein